MTKFFFQDGRHFWTTQRAFRDDVHKAQKLRLIAQESKENSFSWSQPWQILCKTPPNIWSGGIFSTLQFKDTFWSQNMTFFDSKPSQNLVKIQIKSSHFQPKSKRPYKTTKSNVTIFDVFLLLKDIFRQKYDLNIFWGSVKYLLANLLKSRRGFFDHPLKKPLDKPLGKPLSCEKTVSKWTLETHFLSPFIVKCIEQILSLWNRSKGFSIKSTLDL